jgi:Tfp pilus assembly protein PilV
MQSQSIPVACRARLRARVAACLGAQRGDSLIEVMIAALLVALIATAALTGYGAVGHIAGDQRKRGQAASLAAQDQARLRGLTITALSGASGNQSSTTTIDGTTYTVTSKSQFISGASSGSSCTTGGTSTADEVQTTSTVTWAPNNDGRPPVVVHGIVTPSQGGSLVVSATDQTGAGLAGVTTNITGPSTASPLTTDSGGCSVYGGLAGGSYTVAYSDPGHLDVNGNSPANQTLTVIPTQTATAQPVQLAQTGAISASFTTTFNGSTVPATADMFVASNTQLSAPGYRIFGTLSTPSINNYLSTVVSPTTVFPFAGSNNAYSVYAGGCIASSWSGTSPSVPTVVVNPTATSSVTIPEPAMIVDVWAPYTYDDTNAALTLTGTWLRVSGQGSDYNGTETTSLVTNSSMSVSFTGTKVQWYGTTGPAEGKANVLIDNVLVATADLYSGSTKRQQLIYNGTGLTNTAHTLKIVENGTKNASSSGNLISVDAINVPGTNSLLLSKPNVTVTETDAGCGNKDYPPTQIPTPTQGALVSPGQPYGNYSVCADNGTNYNTATVANTSFAVGNVANIYLATGSPGLTSGTCP